MSEHTATATISVATGLTWLDTDEPSGITKGVFRAPLDHADPEGRQIEIAVGRIPAADPRRRRGVLVVLNGGPGGAEAMGMALPARLRGTAIAEVYDIVGLDTRGFGDSAPIFVQELPFPREMMHSRPGKAEFTLIAEAMREAEAACARADDGTRAHLTTRNVARDLDQLRGHLGEERLNILGYAYGTYVASVYGTMFPDRTDRTVLDSSVHPDWPWQAQFQSQPKAIRRNVLAWAAWVAERPHFGFGCTSQAVVNTLHAATKELDRRPRAGITGSIWDAAVGIGATRRSRWGKLAFALSAILDEEAGEEAGEDDVAYLFGLVRQGLRAGVEPSYTAGEVELRARLTTHPGAPEGYREAVMQAVTCEVPWSHDLSDYEALVREYAEHCPWGLGASRAMPWVATWHAERPVEPPTRVDRAGYPAGLVVAAEGDPLDDVAGAQEMAARLGHRLVVVEDDGGHELYPLAGNPHVNAAVEDYLVNGQLPSSPITRVVGESRPDIPTAAEGLVLHE